MPDVVERVLLATRVGVAGVHRDGVLGGEGKVHMGVNVDQCVAGPGVATSLRGAAAAQGRRELEPSLDGIVVHRPVEADADALVGRYVGCITGWRDTDDPRRIEGTGA